jgi:hypothetical protein
MRPSLSTHLAAVVALTWACLGCSRSGLSVDDLGEPLPDGSMASAALNVDDAAVPPSAGGAPAAPAVCLPEEEICNGVDDDCDGDVDEVPPIPCPGGGSRYCIAGRMSECPRRCDTCVPGSVRVCFVSYCTYWGEQTCAADGRGFGPCMEVHVPGACEDVASEHRKSAELQQCCMDEGYCCNDTYDLDGDGNRREVLGRCDEVTCQ